MRRFLRNLWGFLTGHYACWHCHNRFNWKLPVRITGSIPMKDREPYNFTYPYVLCVECFLALNLEEVSCIYSEYMVRKLQIPYLSRRHWKSLEVIAEIKKRYLAEVETSND